MYLLPPDNVIVFRVDERMDESREHVRYQEHVLRDYIGALYSCPTELLFTLSNNGDRNSNGGFSSARCLVPEMQQSRHVDSCAADCGSRVEHDASHSAECSRALPVREVFCRSLPLLSSRDDMGATRSSTASNTGSQADATEEETRGGERCSSCGSRSRSDADALRKALVPMFAGVNIVNSLRSCVPAVPSTERRSEDGDEKRGGEHASALGKCTRLHAGLVPLYDPIVATNEDVLLVFSCIPFRLTTLIQLCRGLRGTSDGRRARDSVDLVLRFVFYQLLRVVDFLHSRGITIGNLRSSNVLLTNHLWVQITPSISRLLAGQGVVSTALKSPPTNSSRGVPATLGSPRRPPGEEYPITYRWAKGMITNLEYLLVVNAAAGRMLGDRLCYPIVPWVSDLTRRLEDEDGDREDSTAGWRDLTMTKFRLRKGDAQLDKSYSESRPPHHIPESLSELTLVVYLARCLPLQVLRDVVRSEVVAQEYPSSIGRMYSWTPDECVPEFFTDPGAFRSAHGDAGGLPDLEVPPWCNGSPEEFVRYHRALLEGKHVSRNLHRWLDVTFGYCLKGQAAIDNKNVPLSLTRRGPGAGSEAWSSRGGLTLGDDTNRPGFVQLFRHPHPPRKPDQIDSITDNDAAPPRARQPASECEPATGSETLRTEEEKAQTATAHERRFDSGDGRHTKMRSDGASGKGGSVSIFGVAFDDYIGEDGVVALSSCKPNTTAGAEAVADAATPFAWIESDAVGAGDTRATIEEDRRALAFGFDVELRLEPWYGGRPRTRRGESFHTVGVESGENGDRGSTAQAADLLACGCILSEMCAGEPVLAGPSYPENIGEGDRRRGWLDGAADLPAPLRGTIAALTHPDPNQRPSAAALLSTADRVQDQCKDTHQAEDGHGEGRGKDHDQSQGERGRSRGALYRGLFPPYIRDVYAFLAAFHQEDTFHKRLILAAAALPVLQVPLHAFYLVVPYLVTLLEPTKPSPLAPKKPLSPLGAAVAKSRVLWEDEAAVERAWVDVLDLFAARLGPSLASAIVLPAALKTLSCMRSPESACRLMDAGLWSTLAKRIDSGAFLRSAFPLLLNWLDRGVSRDISSYGCQDGIDRGDGIDAMGPPDIEGGRQGFNDVLAASAESDDSAASRVQVAAATSISNGVYDCLGPTLSARYIVPALVDCMGRLAAAAAPSDNGDGDSNQEPPDPASLALLEYCRNGGAVGDDRGNTLLVLSRALCDVCVMIGSEEVTVPLVLSRVFHQILPALEPVLLSQSGETCGSATLFRSILEITSLLRRLIPFLCRETISHFYVGLRPPSTSAGVASPPTSRATDFLAEEVTSVPWLLTTMLLPPPLGGLDLPWSADVARLSRSRKEARKGKEEEGVLAAGGDDACESSANTRGDVPAVEQQQQQHPAISSRTSASASTSALSSSGGAAMTPQPSISSDDIPEDLERVTPAALRFVCHVEVARLLAATAMGVLRDEGEEGVEEACTRLLRAGEEFFAAFGRTYGGLVFSSPTMVAALGLAREVHSPFASLFGFDVMRQRVPSVSRRVETWLSRDLAKIPQAAANADADASPGAPGGVAEEIGKEEEEGGAGAIILGEGSDGEDCRSTHVMYISSEVSSEDEGPPPTPSDEFLAVSEEVAAVASLGSSPGGEDLATRSAIKDVEGDTPPQPPLLDWIQHAIKQRLNPDVKGRGNEHGHDRGTNLSKRKGRRQPERRDPSAPEAAGPCGDRAASNGEGFRNKRELGVKGRMKTPPRGMLAWGEKQKRHRSKDEVDPLLPLPTSTLPPPLFPASSTLSQSRGRETEDTGGRTTPVRRGMFSPGRGARLDASDKTGDVVVVAASALEWPSLLGAIGTRAPRSPSTSPSPDRRAPGSSPSPLPVPKPLELPDAGDGEPSKVEEEEEKKKASPTPVVKTPPSSSPPPSPDFRASSSRSLQPSPEPPLPLQPPILPPLPQTCRGLGVEVAERLRERAWLTGIREWGHVGEARKRSGRRGLGQGFRGDSVGTLFPLNMVLQTSFLAHSDRAPVTSMAIEARSESVLLTGSGDGEVRVWSLRDHPAVRLSGFRSGDSSTGSGTRGGGSGRKSHGSSRGARAAVTQLGTFEDAGRAAALDGLIRVWDVERSEGIAICHQAHTANAPPLTAFSLTGCGDGVTPPLDESEWGGELHALCAGGGPSYSAADDQQLSAAYDGGVVHFDCRQGQQGGSVQNISPVALWDAEARLESLRARLPSKSHADTHGTAKRGDLAALPAGLCTVCEGEGSWLAAGSGGGQLVVFDKRRTGGRPLFWWNGHTGAVVGVFHVSRNHLLSVSRDRTAVLWDLSRSLADASGVDFTGSPATLNYPAWDGAGALSDTQSAPGGYGEMPPMRVSVAIGLPDSSPGIFPANLTLLSLGLPGGTGRNTGTSSGGSVFGKGYPNGYEPTAATSPVLFAAAGDKMVASVVRRGVGEEEVYPASFVGPSGKAAGVKASGRRSPGGLAIRSVAVSPLRRLVLLGCGDGWVRVGV